MTMSGETCHTFYGQCLPKIKIEIPIFPTYTSITPMIDSMVGFLLMFRMYNNNNYYNVMLL